MLKKWESMDLHEHPVKHQAGTFGKVVLSVAGIYCLKVGAAIMSCPQEWAAQIHAGEDGIKVKIQQAIALLLKTKSAFKSADVEEARKILESIIAD